VACLPALQFPVFLRGPPGSTSPFQVCIAVLCSNHCLDVASHVEVSDDFAVPGSSRVTRSLRTMFTTSSWVHVLIAVAVDVELQRFQLDAARAGDVIGCAMLPKSGSRRSGRDR